MKTSYLGDRIGANALLSFDGYICLPLDYWILNLHPSRDCHGRSNAHSRSSFYWPVPRSCRHHRDHWLEFAGWYPEYWEYYAITREGEWETSLSSFLEPYPEIFDAVEPFCTTCALLRLTLLGRPRRSLLLSSNPFSPVKIFCSPSTLWPSW